MSWPTSIRSSSIFFFMFSALFLFLFFFFNAPATTEIYTLSLHDALPISARDATRDACLAEQGVKVLRYPASEVLGNLDRKSTRLNSSHVRISYAVFCLKKKIANRQTDPS